MKVGVNFWYLAPTWGFGTPWKASINWATAYSSSAAVWSDAFLADLQPFKVLRLMDWNGTNHSKITSWSQRRLPTDPGNASIYVDQSTGIVPGLAYEWQFDLCSRTQKTCWITLPMQADDQYLVEFAKLAKAKLAPGLSLVVELSNEPDGGWFSQTAQAQAKAAQLGLPGAAPWYQGAAFVTYRTLQVRKALQDQFGSDVGSRVLVGRCTVGNTDLMRQSLTTVYKSAQWNPTNQKLDLLCMSAYFGNGRDGSTYTLAQAKQDIDSLVNSGDGFKAIKGVATANGIPTLVVYEGGVHVLSNAGVFSAKPEAGQAMTYLLDQAAPYFNWFTIYTDSSTWPNTQGNGAWGLKSQIGGPETSKSTAVKNWIVSHP